ncbi:MAG: CDP-glucose 4,6-dehydratase [Gemmatimonadota bacterium]|nr:CDP-glucose 4,6-dehydratase [Gemmatimonadota bacterium]
MEDLVSPNRAFWRGRSVFLTGHTGFKGSWLTLWLHELGAIVHGYALDPPTNPALFHVARIEAILSSGRRANLLDLAELETAISATRPEIVFHLAAQPLVRQSYLDPVGTLLTNIIGTANVLEATRKVDSVQAVVLVTTDKVYANENAAREFREADTLGGNDLYSASKAAAEIVAASYRASFFTGSRGHRARVATARAGNVIGGGDWAVDRLIPDCLRSFEGSIPVPLRCPNSVRPWQHVLEPLAGYIRLAERLCSDNGGKYATAWNFGPASSDEATVREVAAAAARIWGDGAKVEHSSGNEDPPEAHVLRLNSAAARAKLGWKPRWSLERALQRTVEWHRCWLQGADMDAVTRSQIRAFELDGLQ